MTHSQLGVGRIWSRFGATVLVLALLAACSDTSSEPEQDTAPDPTAAEEPALEVALLQYRLDQARRRVQVAVTNRSPAPIEVLSVALEAPGYTAMPPTPKDAELAPAARVNLPVVLGEARCAQDSAQSAGQPVVLARVRGQDGSEHEVEVTLPSPDETLDRLLTRECNQLALARAMSVTFDPTWTPAEVDGHRTLHGSLAVQRMDSAEPLTITGTAGSVIFTLLPRDATRSPLLVLAPGEPRGDIPIEITVSRCDPHGLADSSRTFFLPLWAVVGDGDEVATTITVDDAARARLMELIQTGCGL